MRRPAGIAALVGVALVIAALVVSGMVPTTTRTFALREPNIGPVARVTHRHAACEGPITSDGAARDVEIFGTEIAGDPHVSLTVRSMQRQRRLIAQGLIRHPRASSQQMVPLSRPIPGGVPVRVCIQTSTGAYGLKGAGATNGEVQTTGVQQGSEFSLLLTRPETFFSSLTTAFARASIFRPDWVGAWLFWLLLGLLAATFVAATIGVHSASRADRSAQGG